MGFCVFIFSSFFLDTRVKKKGSSEEVTFGRDLKEGGKPRDQASGCLEESTGSGGNTGFSK